MIGDFAAMLEAKGFAEDSSHCLGQFVIERPFVA